MTENQEQKTVFKRKWVGRKTNRSKQNTKMEWCKRRKNDLLKIIENIFRKGGETSCVMVCEEFLTWVWFFDKFQWVS